MLVRRRWTSREETCKASRNAKNCAYHSHNARASHFLAMDGVVCSALHAQAQRRPARLQPCVWCHHEGLHIQIFVTKIIFKVCSSDLFFIFVEPNVMPSFKVACKVPSQYFALLSYCMYPILLVFSYSCIYMTVNVIYIIYRNQFYRTWLKWVDIPTYWSWVLDWTAHDQCDTLTHGADCKTLRRVT